MYLVNLLIQLIVFLLLTFILLVTIFLSRPSYAVIVLSQLDDRYFRGLQGRFLWSFDFLLFKKGDTEAEGTSSQGRTHMRSVNLEMDLEAGEYVLHVRTCSILWMRVTVMSQVRLDREISSEFVRFIYPFLTRH